jgi:hypothetical protein
LWFWRSSPRSLPASILDALRQTTSLANAEEEGIAPSCGRPSSGRAGPSPPLMRAMAPACDTRGEPDDDFTRANGIG